MNVPRASLLGCGLAAALLPRSALAQSAPLRVGTDPFDSYAEPYYAQDLGLFQKAGLNVEITTLSNGAAITNGVASGALDIGISNPVQLANAILHGIPLALIAGAGMYSSKAPTTVLCVAKSSLLQSAKDLNGKTVAVTALKDILAATVTAWLSEQGADPRTIRFIELPFPQMGPALERGTVDAAAIAEPALEAALERDEVRIFAKPFDAVAPLFYIGTFFSTTSFVKSNPAAIKQFVEVIYDTARWANQNPQASSDILIKYAKLPASVARKMTRVVYGENLSAARLQPLLDLSYKYGIVSKPMTVAQMIAAS